MIPIHRAVINAIFATSFTNGTRMSENIVRFGESLIKIWGAFQRIAAMILVTIWRIPMAIIAAFFAGLIRR